MTSVKVLALVVGVFIMAIACGEDGGNSDGNGSPGSGDFVKLSIDGGVANTFTESFSADIVCDPRVDWAFKQVILYDNYIGSGQWDMIFDIMFISDSLGTYDITVPADGLQIEGAFTTTAIDAGSSQTTLSGSFGVESGNSLSCP